MLALPVGGGDPAEDVGQFSALAGPEQELGVLGIRQ